MQTSLKEHKFIIYINYGHTICHVKNKTPQMYELAVQQNGLALVHIFDHQTEQICELAVQQNGLALQYARFQTPKIREIAINQNPNAVKHVRMPTYETYPIEMIRDDIDD
jgi:hypothetical protein